MPRKAHIIIDGIKHKHCSGCDQIKTLDMFGINRSTWDGIASYCRSCRLRYSRMRTYDPYARRDAALKHNYGLDHVQYDLMLLQQNGKCAICLTAKPGGRGGFHVDHCHKTNKVRGLLCHHCNTAIGKLGDDPAMLRRAIAYLETHAA